MAAIPAAATPDPSWPPTLGREIRIVPRSFLAMLLAGLVVAFLQASLDLGAMLRFGQQLGAVVFSGTRVPLVPLILFGSLWTAARSAGFSVLIVHALLAARNITQMSAYALWGGGVGLLWSAVLGSLGVSDFSNLAVNTLMGAVGAFFYRIFAGTRPL